MAGLLPISGCDQRFGDQQPAGGRQTSIATRHPLSASTAEQVENALYTAYGQRQISTIYAPNDEFWVVMELEEKYQRDPTALSLLYIRSSTGNLVPLSAVASLGTSLGPLTRESPGPASGRDHFVQPEAGRGDRRSRESDQRHGAIPAAYDHVAVSGHGAGV